MKMSDEKIQEIEQVDSGPGSGPSPSGLSGIRVGSPLRAKKIQVDTQAINAVSTPQEMVAFIKGCAYKLKELYEEEYKDACVAVFVYRNTSTNEQHVEAANMRRGARNAAKKFYEVVSKVEIEYERAIASQKSGLNDNSNQEVAEDQSLDVPF